MVKLIISWYDSFIAIDNSNKLILLLIVIVPRFLIFQGLNFIDEGFAISNYGYFFSNPEAINYSFMYYLTDFFGALIVFLTKSVGLIGIRIGRIFCVYLIGRLAYVVLKKIIPIRFILIGILIYVLFLNNVYILNWFNYNYLNIVFYLMSIYFLYSGLVENKNNQIFLSGLFLGVNVFTKVSNLIGFCLIFIAPVFFLIYKYKKYVLKLLKIFFLFVLGFFGGMLIVILLIKILGHYDLFLDSLNYLKSIGGSGGHHSIVKLILMYLKNYIFIILISGFFVFVSYFIVKIIEKYIKNVFYRKKVMIGIGMLIGISLGLISALKFLIKFKIFGFDPLISYVSYLVPGLSFFLLILGIINKKSKQILLMSVFSLFLIYFSSFGSGGYIEYMAYGTILFFPLYLFYIHEETNDLIKKVLYFIIIVVSFASILGSFLNIYSDSYNRFLLGFNARDISKLQYIYTIREKRDLIEKVVYISNTIKQNDMLALGHIPLFYYISNKLPFVGGNSCPEYFTFSDFKKNIDVKLLSGKTPSMIIINTFDSVDDSIKIKNYVIDNVINKYKYNKTILNMGFEVYVLY